MIGQVGKIGKWCMAIGVAFLIAGAEAAESNVDAAEFGFSPDAEPAVNAVALQRALDGGRRTVRVTVPGVYKLDRTIFLDDETTLDCADGVVFEKAKRFANVFANRGAFGPYRDWTKAKPVTGGEAKAKLDDEERVLRYKLHLLEFLENYVNMRRLYDVNDLSIFQTGVLRIDAKEMNLCFHVDSEAAHSALAEKSRCCIIYLKLTRPSEGAERSICAVVTAGTVAGLYAGRNGVFYDRDGKDWEAVVTKVVESQVSLAEAFWAPWKKLGESVSGLVKKFLGDRQASVDASMTAGKLPPAANGKDGQASGGAAMASSVAAIGIGVGMLGAAMASVLAAVKGMGPCQILLSIVAIIAVVSLPSMILTWFKLRRRDIGAILNASGWAINREMRFSMKRARAFTKCARSVWALRLMCVALALVVLGLGGYAAYLRYCPRKCSASACSAPACTAPATPAAEQPAAPATPAAPAAETLAQS